jgi:hypothetical protein
MKDGRRKGEPVPIAKPLVQGLLLQQQHLRRDVYEGEIQLEGS